MCSISHPHALRFLTFVIIIGTMATLQAQQESKTPNDKSSVLSGIVVNDGGQPMPGVAVRIGASWNQTSISTTTAADGSFRVGGLERAIYAVSAYAPTYVRGPWDPNDPINYYTPGDSIRLQLVKGAVITGTVTTLSGEPVIGVPVRAFLIRGPDGKVPSFLSQRAAERTTDDRGIYRMYGLAAGTYLVAAGGTYFNAYNLNAYDDQAPTYAPSSNRDSASEFVIGPGEELANVDIKYRAEPGHVISGTVKGPAANSTFNVTLNSISMGTFMRSAYQAPGNRGFMFTGLPDDTYEVTAASNEGELLTVSDPTRLIVKGKDVTGLELLTKPLASLTGRVLLISSKAAECAGKRQLLLTETMVAVRQAEDKPLANPYSRSATVPDQDGAFTFQNVRPGKYRLVPRLFAKYWYVQSIKLPQSAKTASAEAAGTAVDLKSGDPITGITITVAQGAASLRGNIVASDSEPRPPNLYLFLVPAEKESAEDPLRFFATQIQSDSTFAINNLPPGRYWSLLQKAADKQVSLLQSPAGSESRAKLLRDAEAAKSTIEFKPCQSVSEYKVNIK